MKKFQNVWTMKSGSEGHFCKVKHYRKEQAIYYRCIIKDKVLSNMTDILH